MKHSFFHDNTRSRGPQPERQTRAARLLRVWNVRAGSGPLAAVRRAAGMALLLGALTLSAAAQGTVNLKPIEESVHSGIATNRWTAVTNGTVLRSVMAVNPTATDYWLFVVNSSSTNITDGWSTNVAAFKVPASGAATAFYDPPNGEVCRAGITIIQSTTFPTITNPAASSAALVLTVKHSKN